MFNKVSRSRFRQESFSGYENIVVPENICGKYTLISPVEKTIKSRKRDFIPTGLSCELNQEVLLVLINGKAFIYNEKYNADKDGHIILEYYNESDSSFTIQPGDKIAEAYIIKVKYEK